MLNDEELKAALDKSPAERVTMDYMRSRIKETTFMRFSETVTVCQITLDNGYSVRGESACVHRENYNKEIGETISEQNALDKLWPLFGFLLAEATFRAAKSI